MKFILCLLLASAALAQHPELKTGPNAGLGGPNYFMRNVMFNIIHESFKISRFSQGDVIMHNTVIKAGDGLGIHTSEPFDHALITHNLFIGGRTSQGAKYGGYSPGRGRGVDAQNFGGHCVIDFNAYASHGMPFEGKIRSWTFNKLPGTEFEPHGMLVTLDVLTNPIFPDDPAKVYDPPDLRIKPESAIQDTAAPFPNANDISQDKAPDIGAYEVGADLPVYGPRT